MAKRLLLLSDENQLHKCHLNENEPKNIQVGNEWSQNITFLNLDNPIFIEWNGEYCQMGDQSLRMNEHLTFNHGGQSIHLFLTEEKEWQRYDTAGQYSMTFGSKEYDDVVVKDTSVDFVLIREELGQPFRLEVNDGQVYHNYYRTMGNVELEPGDQLYFAGMIVKVGKDDIEILASECLIATKLVRLYGKDHGFTDEYPDYHRSPRIIYREPEEKLKISKPSNKPRKPSEQLGRAYCTAPCYDCGYDYRDLISPGWHLPHCHVFSDARDRILFDYILCQKR